MLHRDCGESEKVGVFHSGIKVQTGTEINCTDTEIMCPVVTASDGEGPASESNEPLVAKPSRYIQLSAHAVTIILPRPCEAKRRLVRTGTTTPHDWPEESRQDRRKAKGKTDLESNDGPVLRQCLREGQRRVTGEGSNVQNTLRAA